MRTSGYNDTTGPVAVFGSPCRRGFAASKLNCVRSRLQRHEYSAIARIVFWDRANVRTALIDSTGSACVGGAFEVGRSAQHESWIAGVYYCSGPGYDPGIDRADF